MATFDPEDLIREVEARPPLYNRSLPEYSDKNIKDNLWKEIAAVLTKDWDSYNYAAQVIRSKEMQIKWKNIRDSYRKEICGQRASANNGRRKRKYVYFHLLSFLEPSVLEVPRRENIESEVEIVELDPDATDKLEIVEMDPDITDINSKESISTPPSIIYKNRRKRFIRNTKKAQNRIGPAKTNSETDEDRLFCMSLIPSFKKLDDDKKLRAKIEILNVIHSLSFPQSSYISHQGYHNAPGNHDQEDPLEPASPDYNLSPQPSTSEDTKFVFLSPSHN